MEKVTIIVLVCLAIGSTTLAKPASNEQLDKATVNDVAVNAVTPDSKAEEKKDNGSVQITGITTGVENNQNNNNNNNNNDQNLFKPQRAGSMFARFIDDIFQIPIAVLQNVARLITNPFTQQKKTPEAIAAA